MAVNKLAPQTDQEKHRYQEAQAIADAQKRKRLTDACKDRVQVCVASVRPNLVPCSDLVLFASTTVCCAGRPTTRYRAAREPPPPRVDSCPGLQMCAQRAHAKQVPS